MINYKRLLLPRQSPNITVHITTITYIAPTFVPTITSSKNTIGASEFIANFINYYDGKICIENWMCS